MRVLFTGASSALGERVLRRLLDHADYSEIWCGLHKRNLAVAHSKLRTFELDLARDVHLDKIPGPLDLVIHFAALTHTQENHAYWDINFSGTLRLISAARALGCRSFFYVSTRCATAGSGAYGESKLAVEAELQKQSWESLLILRPAEVYGAGTREGVDGFVRLASKWHVVPLLWGHRGIQFAPIHIDDFVECMWAILRNHSAGVRVLELCGPEKLNGVTLSLRLARRYTALPFPIWFPGMALMLRVFNALGWKPVTPDQVSRLVGPKTATNSSDESALVSDMIRFPERAIT